MGVIIVLLIIIVLIGRFSKFRRNNGFNRILKREYLKKFNIKNLEN
jgi:hypothetical protein